VQPVAGTPVTVGAFWQGFRRETVPLINSTRLQIRVHAYPRIDCTRPPVLDNGFFILGPTALRGAVGVWDCESSDRIKGLVDYKELRDMDAYSHGYYYNKNYAKYGYAYSQD